MTQYDQQAAGTYYTLFIEKWCEDLDDYRSFTYGRVGKKRLLTITALRTTIQDCIDRGLEPENMTVICWEITPDEELLPKDEESWSLPADHWLERTQQQ